MGFRQKLKYTLVHTLGYSNKEAQELIESGRLRVSDRVVTENTDYDGIAEIRLDEKVIKPAVAYDYYIFYKPRGIETTFYGESCAGLKALLPFYKKGLSYAGRLDKESEGLLLLSNDGKYIEMLTNPASVKEKEYVVEVHKAIDAEFIEKMKQGLEIMGQQTRPCKAWQTGENTFRIILTEGRNRQIRRMCYKLGYEVEKLKRIRIDCFELEDLKPGEYRKINT